MYRLFTTALTGILLSACGVSEPPLLPVADPGTWVRVVFDTTGSNDVRRIEEWVDTAHVMTLASGVVQARQKAVMDMKSADVSINMQMLIHVDCASRRLRPVGVDSVIARVNGAVLPDSVAREAVAAQWKVTDTTWVAAGAVGTGTGNTVNLVCPRPVDSLRGR